MQLSQNYENYAAVPAANWSSLKELRKSALHYKYALENSKKETPSLLLGRAVHAAILEPETWHDAFAVRPDGIDRRTKTGKEDYALFEAQSHGKAILTEDAKTLAWEIGRCVREHPLCAHFFSQSDSFKESTIVWTDARTGLDCKARFDLCSRDHGLLVEIKTATSIGEREFSYQAWKLGYFHQLAFYAAGLKTLYGTEPDLRIVAVESSPPHDVGVFVPCLDTMYAAEQDVADLLQHHLHCTKTGRWPGQHPNLTTLSAPRFALPLDE